jgi:hypothetical protein
VRATRTGLQVAGIPCLDSSVGIRVVVEGMVSRVYCRIQLQGEGVGRPNSSHRARVGEICVTPG